MFLEPTNLHFEFAFVKIPASNTIALLLFCTQLGQKFFDSYGVPKFKPIHQKKFHICSCFVVVFPLNVKKILVTGFEYGYTVTALYFVIQISPYIF